MNVGLTSNVTQESTQEDYIPPKAWPAGHCPSASLFQLFQESQQTLTHHLFQVGQQMIPLSSFRFFKSVAFLTGKIYTEQISF